MTTDAGEAAKTIVRRNTEEVQGGGDFELFDELFADDFVDHTTAGDHRRQGGSPPALHLGYGATRQQS